MEGYLDLGLFDTSGKYREPVEETKYPDLSDLVEGSFSKKLENVDEMPEQDLFIGIDKNIGDMTRDILTNKGQRYIKFFSNVKFMKALSRVLFDKNIGQTSRIAFNKIIYDYLRLKNQDIDIKEIMLDRLAYGINHRDIEALKSYGFNDTNSKMIVISRYSSDNEELCAIRLNRQLCTMSASTMNPESLVYIYELLYDRVTDLFLATMFESFSDAEWNTLPEDYRKIFNNISYVILTILNNMTTPQIDTILNIYRGKWEERGMKPTRFSLRALSRDFYRISNIVEYYRSNNVYIP